MMLMPTMEWITQMTTSAKQYVYPLIRFSGKGPFRMSVLAVYLTEEAAKKAFDSMPEDEEDELQIEEWPANEFHTKFNVMVIANK